MLLISTVAINAMRTRAVYASFFQRSFDTGITGGGSGLLLPVVAFSLSLSLFPSLSRSIDDGSQGFTPIVSPGVLNYRSAPSYTLQVSYKIDLGYE